MRDYLLNEEELADFSDMIPNRYQSLVASKEVFAILTMDDFNDNEPVGICVMGVREGWAQILECAMFPGYDSEDYAADIIERRIRDAQKAGYAKGIFAEFEETVGSMSLSSAYALAGFEIQRSRGNVFEFALSDVDRHMLPNPGDMKKYIRIAEADENMRRSLAKVIQTDKRSIPVSLPIQWRQYDRALSLIRLDDGEPSGTVLVQREDDIINIALLYSKSGEGFLKMISALIANGGNVVTSDTRIIVPIVEKRLFDVMKKLVPGGEASTEFKAYLPFGMNNSRIQALREEYAL